MRLQVNTRGFNYQFGFFLFRGCNLENIFQDHRGVKFNVEQCKCGHNSLRVEYCEHKYFHAFVDGGRVASSLLSHLAEVKGYKFQCVRCGEVLKHRKIKVLDIKNLNRLEVV